MLSTEPQLTRSIDEPDAATYSWGERMMRILSAPVQLLGALFVPDRFMPRIVAREKGAVALLAVVLCAGLSAFVIGQRVDTTAAVLAEETQMLQMGGENAAEPRTDREISEEIAKRDVMTQVMLGLGAGAWTPLLIGLLALGVFAAGRFVGGKPTMPKAFAAAAHGMLPMGVKSLAIAASAWTARSLSPVEIDKLRAIGTLGPIGPFEGIDLFAVWAAVLFCFGLAAAASITRRRALIATVVGFILLFLFFGAVVHPPMGMGHGMPMRGNS